MPHFTLPSGVKLYYEIHGAPDAPETLVFSHGLLWSGRMFEKQVEHFKSRYRVVTYDHRGQGQSDGPPSVGPSDGYDMETIYADAVALVEGLALGPVHFAGLSMGGFVGMRLAARRPDLLRSLILMETSADGEPEENRPKYKLLNAVVRYVGVWAVVGPVMKIMFGQTFLNDPARAAERKRWIAELKQNRPYSITRATNGVIERKAVFEEIKGITVPTLIMVGEEDVATKPEKARRIHRQISGSTLVLLPRAGHSASIEEPAAVNEALEEFLSTVS